ncbi:hypothetical protein WMY93_000909 [Mugilogobius chulae]|uniref:Uncharacterized protein n=1 Tax=Mugilogobius chulae TaxID=88201 RepID=A0AAW0Q0A5_9GOBI
MEQRRWGKEDNIPLTEDVLTLQNYLEKIENEAKAELKEHASSAAYKKLCESLLAQIIVFNKKQEGEASRLTLEMYQRADTGPLNKDIYDTLSPVEQQLSHKLTRLVTRGKRGRKVPVLLLERTKASLDVLIENRTAAGVRAENPFLFARPGTNSNFRGCECLRKFAEESKAKHPELLRSTKLRKHVATLCQLLKLHNQELEQVARFMGHDIRDHCQYYRQTDKTFQIAKIGKLLFAMEHGRITERKNLTTLDTVISGRRSATVSSRSLRGDDLARDSEDHYDEDLCSSSGERPMKSNKKIQEKALMRRIPPQSLQASLKKTVMMVVTAQKHRKTSEMGQVVHDDRHETSDDPDVRCLGWRLDVSWTGRCEQVQKAAKRLQAVGKVMLFAALTLAKRRTSGGNGTRWTPEVSAPQRQKDDRKIDNEAPTGDDVSDASAKANGSERGRDSTEASQLSLKDISEQISCLNTELTASWVTFKEDLRREMRDDFAQFTMQMEQQLASTSLKLQEHDQKLDEAATRIDEQENWSAVANEALQQLLMEHKTLQES